MTERPETVSTPSPDRPHVIRMEMDHAQMLILVELLEAIEDLQRIQDKLDAMTREVSMPGVYCGNAVDELKRAAGELLLDHTEDLAEHFRLVYPKASAISAPKSAIPQAKGGEA